MKAVGFAALTIFLTAEGGWGRAQAGVWRAYSPPRGGFSVETPVPLRRVKSFDGDHGVDFDPEQGRFGWITSYAAVETTPRDCRFGVVVVSGRLQAISSMGRGKFLEYLSWQFFADEDELQFLRAPVEVRHGGLSGNEYSYVKNIGYPYGGKLFTRGRIFDTGNKIYIIIFVGGDEKELTSPAAERFLNSFRLRGRAPRA